MEPERSGVRASQVVAIVVCFLVGLPFVLGLISVLASLLGDENHDPHGYALIFGSVLCLVSGVFVLLVLPYAAPDRWRRATQRAATAILVAVAAGLLLFAGAAYL